MDSLASSLIAKIKRNSIISTINGCHLLFLGDLNSCFPRFHHYVANLERNVIGCFKDLNLDDDEKFLLSVLLLYKTLRHFEMIFEMVWQYRQLKNIKLILSILQL